MFIIFYLKNQILKHKFFDLKAEESWILNDQQSKVKIDEDDLGKLDEEDEIVQLVINNEDVEENMNTQEQDREGREEILDKVL